MPIRSVRKMKRKTEKRCVVNGMPDLPKRVDEELSRAGGFDTVISNLPEISKLKKTADMHRALSDPIRLRIIHSLRQCDLCPCILKKITRLSDSRLSYHLNILEAVGLVSSYSDKRWRIYKLSNEGRLLTETIGPTVLAI